MSSTPPEADESGHASKPLRLHSNESRKGTGVYLPNAALLSPTASLANPAATMQLSSAQRTAKQQQGAVKELTNQNQHQTQSQHRRPSSSRELKRQHSTNTPPARPASALAVIQDPQQQQQYGQDVSSSAKHKGDLVVRTSLEGHGMTPAAGGAAARGDLPSSAAEATAAAAAAASDSVVKPLSCMEPQQQQQQQLGSFDMNAGIVPQMLDDSAMWERAADLMAMQQQQQQLGQNGAAAGATSSAAATCLAQLQLYHQQQQLLSHAGDSQLSGLQHNQPTAAAGPDPALWGSGDMSTLLHKALPLRGLTATSAGTAQQRNELLAAQLLALRQQGMSTRQLFGVNPASDDMAAFAAPGAVATPVMQQRLHMQQQQQAWGQLQSVPEHSSNNSVESVPGAELAQLQGLRAASWPSAGTVVAAAAGDSADGHAPQVGRQAVTLLQLQQLRRQHEQQQQQASAEQAVMLGAMTSNREHLVQQLQHVRRQQERQQQQQQQHAIAAASSLLSCSQDHLQLLPQEQLCQQLQRRGPVDITTSSLFSSSQERMLLPQQQQQGGSVDIAASGLFANKQQHVLLQQEQYRQQQQQQWQASADIVPGLGPAVNSPEHLLLQLQQLQQQQLLAGGRGNVQQALGIIDAEINRLMQLCLDPASAAAAAGGGGSGLMHEQAWQQQMIAARAAVRAAANTAEAPAAAAYGSRSNRSSMDTAFPFAVQQNSMDSERFAVPSSSRSSMEVASVPYALQRSNRNSVDMQPGRGSIDMQYSSRGSMDMQASRGSLDMGSPYGAVGSQFAGQQQQQQLMLQQRQQQSLQGVNLDLNQGVSMDDIQARLQELRETQDMKKLVEDQLMQFLPL